MLTNMQNLTLKEFKEIRYGFGILLLWFDVDFKVEKMIVMILLLVASCLWDLNNKKSNETETHCFNIANLSKKGMLTTIITSILIIVITFCYFFVIN